MTPLKYDSPLKRVLIGICRESLSVVNSQFRRPSVPVLVIAVGFFMGAPLMAETIAGDAIVIDGRTLEVSGQMVRLWGIDSPDLDQTCSWGQKVIPCGRLAQGALKDLIIGAEVRCELRQIQEEPLRIAVCFADSYDIGANLIHTGWALALDPTSPVYRETERKAHTAKRGLWRGEFIRPADWRAKSDGRK